MSTIRVIYEKDENVHVCVSQESINQIIIEEQGDRDNTLEITDF